MPIVSDFVLPDSAKFLPLGDGPAKKFFIAYVASADPATGQPWCPDVRVALPLITTIFSAEDAPEAALVRVGQKPEWKDPNNFYRTNWDVQFIPTLVRYQTVDGQVKEVARLDGDDILDENKIREWMA
ncbi:thioredoxin-like protein 5 [Thozetella sp. PMI_491]|nr:thioredoxin-like protein 5 [Thozetella sp. PMI_491]